MYKKRCHRSAWLIVLFAVVLESIAFSGKSFGDDSSLQGQKEAEKILHQFQAAWKPQQGYMRPLDDAGWKARLEALQRLVRLGDQAVPALTDALTKAEPETRIFAAQALMFIAHPAARPALETTLKTDAQPAVRLYAVDAMSMFGRLENQGIYQQLRQADPNRDVRSHVAFAMERDEAPQPVAIQKALLDYDLANMDTAKLGQQAPDFMLSDVRGAVYRLSDHRFKTHVVLIFIYGDT